MSHEHDSLPLPEYDHVPIGHLPGIIAPLLPGDIEQLVQYEREHGNRLPVLQVLERRLEALRSGAEPADGGAPMADLSPEVGGGSQVTPATSGPKINPPSQGVPTNPAQPR